MANILTIIIDNTSNEINLTKCLKSWTSLKFNGEVVSTIPINTAGTIEIGDAVALDRYDYSNFKTFVYAIPSMISMSGNLNLSNTVSVSSMFNGYGGKIVSLDLSLFDTSNITDMSGMFIGCRLLENLNISSFKTSQVTNMSSMFCACAKLKALNLSNFDTSNVTNMNSMFEGISDIPLDLSNFNTSNVTDMGYMFKGCSCSSLDLSTFDTSKVVNMNYMFGGISSSSLDLSNFNTSNVTDMSYMFRGAKTTTLNLTNFDTSNVTDMTYMFGDLENMTSLTLNFNSVNVTSMNNMFSCCILMESLNLNFNTSNVTDMSYMFLQCFELKTLEISSFNTVNVNTMEFMFGDCSKLMSLDLSFFDTTNINNMYGMFWRARNLKDLNISNFVLSSTVSVEAFLDSCSQLNFIDLSGENTPTTTIKKIIDTITLTQPITVRVSDLSKVEGLSYPTITFEGIIRDTRVAEYIYNTDTNSGGSEPNRVILPIKYPEIYDVLGEVVEVTKTQEALSSTRFKIIIECPTTIKIGAIKFYYMRGLEEVLYLRSANLNDITSMFQDCENLTYVDLKTLNLQNITDIDSLFYSCSKLTISDSDFDGVDLSNITNASYSFYNTNLQSLNMGRFSNLENAGGMLRKTGIVSVDTSTNLKIKNYSYFVGDCGNLTMANLKITSLTTDLSCLFADCRSLSTINISEWETINIKNYSFLFRDCTSLVNIDLSTLKFNNSQSLESMFSGVSEMNFQFNTINIQGASSLKTMFESSKVTRLDLRTWDFSSVTNFSSMFSGCSELTELIFPKLTMTHYISIDGIIDSTRKLKQFDMSVFDNIKVLSNIHFGDIGLETLNLSKIKLISNRTMCFNYCSFLKSVDFPLDINGNNYTLTNFNNMFAGCSALEEISLNVLNVGAGNCTFYGIFSNCSNLKSIEMFYSIDDTSYFSGYDEMFSNCVNLERIQFGKFTFSDTNIQNYYNTFLNCNKLIKVYSNFIFDDLTKVNSIYKMLSKDIPNNNGFIVTYGGHKTTNGEDYIRDPLSSWEYSKSEDNKGEFNGKSIISKYLGDKRLYGYKESMPSRR